MNKDWFNLLTLPFIIIVVLIALKILLRCYLYLVYKRIIVPLVSSNDGANTTGYDVISKYFESLKMKQITFKASEKQLALFSNFNQKTNIFKINNLYANLLKTNLCQLNFDYLLSRCWLTQKIVNNKSEYLWIKLTYYFLPIINSVIFWLTLILLIAFNIASYYSATFRNNHIIFNLNRFNIFLSILITSGYFSIIYIFIENLLKLKLENDYEKAVKPFIIEHFAQYYHDWIAARMYSRSIIFANFYLKPFLNAKNQQLKYLGVFVKV